MISHPAAPAEIKEGPTDRRVMWGTAVVMKCDAIGEPEPHIQWLRDGKPVSFLLIKRTAIGFGIL